jgi:hypothetical protein
MDDVDDDAALVVEQEIHGLRDALERDQRGLLRVLREPEAAGEIVAGAERDDRDRTGTVEQPEAQEGVDARVDRPVAAEDDDLPSGRVAERRADSFRPLRDDHLGLGAGAEDGEGGVDGGVVGRAGRAVRQDEEGAGGGHGVSLA